MPPLSLHGENGFAGTGQRELWSSEAQQVPLHHLTSGPPCLLQRPSSPSLDRETADSACGPAARLVDDMSGAPLSNVHSRWPVSLSSATS